jgi:hypothetical protein
MPWTIQVQALALPVRLQETHALGFLSPGLSSPSCSLSGPGMPMLRIVSVPASALPLCFSTCLQERVQSIILSKIRRNSDVYLYAMC